MILWIKLVFLGLFFVCFSGGPVGAEPEAGSMVEQPLSGTKALNHRKSTRQWHSGGRRTLGGEKSPADNAWKGVTGTLEEQEASASEEVVYYCTDLNFKPTVYVNFSAFPPNYSYEYSIEELTEKSKHRRESLKKELEENGNENDPRRVELEHITSVHTEASRTLGFARSEAKSFSNGGYLVRRVNTRNGCPYLNNLHVDIEFKYTVYIAKELLRNECMEDHVKEHEDLHIEVYKTLRERYEDVMRKRLDKYINEMEYIRLPENKWNDRVEEISKGVGNIIQGVFYEEMEESIALNNMIDSKTEYSYTSIACKN